jgi:hypothetical protein
MAFPDPRLARQAVRLVPGATIGTVFLPPPSVAYVVITNPNQPHDTRYHLAKPHTVVFAGQVAVSGARRLAAVSLKLRTVRIDAGGL